jgi:hypothetical protein
VTVPDKDYVEVRSLRAHAAGDGAVAVRGVFFSIKVGTHLQG